MVDLFPQTFHLETIVRLGRMKTGISRLVENSAWNRDQIRAISKVRREACRSQGVVLAGMSETGFDPFRFDEPSPFEAAQ